MSKCSASWAIVRSPLMAASATFALKAGEWFRRGRLFMVSPVRGDYRRSQAETPLIVLSRFPRPALLGSRRVDFGVFVEQLQRIDDVHLNGLVNLFIRHRCKIFGGSFEGSASSLSAIRRSEIAALANASPSAFGSSNCNNASLMACWVCSSLIFVPIIRVQLIGCPDVPNYQSLLAPFPLFPAANFRNRNLMTTPHPFRTWAHPERRPHFVQWRC